MTLYPTMLDILPAEIIIQIFSHLGYRDLLACDVVCHFFHTIVQKNVSCQYTIDLAVSGMQNGPPGVLCHADRLAMLRKSQTAWKTLQWTALKDVDMMQGSLYELYGGVLVQSTRLSGCGLVFRRLPSHYRGIKEHVWSLELDFVLRDFTLDPAQDLLVLIAQPVFLQRANDLRKETSIHIRSLTTGKVHPLARKSPVLVHDVDARAANLTFMIQVHGERVAVQFVSRGIAPSELVVWNWQTGETLLNTYSDSLMAFAFLTERLILVGGFGEVAFNLRQPRLFVVDVESQDGARTEFEQVEYVCTFSYPACYPWVHVLSFLIRSDPSAGWTPDAKLGVPFSIGTGPRLYVVTIWVMHGEEITPIDLFVLSSTLLEHVGTVGEGEGGREFEWGEWGPKGTRMMTHAPHSHVWVCYVFGTRFSAIRRGMVEMWDFNPLGMRREGGGCVEEESVVSRRVFVGEVRTSLAYRVVRRALGDEAGSFTEAMCSEDGVVLVDTRARRFRVLIF